MSYTEHKIVKVLGVDGVRWACAAHLIGPRCSWASNEKDQEAATTLFNAAHKAMRKAKE